ncbi:N-acetyltransferase [Xanthomonas citri pv. aurantifolii str. ICPB 10535]|nr:N-acetyltransferase [Xanthomonas citri pv. aurantifolii str. ICPB 10535]
MSRPAPQIRSATPADVPLLHELITALAVYEREPDAVKASLEDVRASLFDEGATAHALICEQDGQALGFAVYFFNYSTWLGRNGLYLEDLFVRPEARGPCAVAALGAAGGAAWLRAVRMVGTGLEPAGHRLLQGSRCAPDGRLDRVPARRRTAGRVCSGRLSRARRDVGITQKEGRSIGAAFKKTGG